MTEIRLPELTGGSQGEQLKKIQTYLFTLAQQLQMAFDSLQGDSNEKIVSVSSSPAGQKTDVAALKALILKSARVTEVLEERVEKRLEGKYLAVSQFGTYQQQTSQTITANSQAIQQQFTNLQQLTSAVEQLDSSVKEVNASIRTGQLSDGVYGVEIGQQEWTEGVVTFRRFARLTAQKLSFYDSGGVEVAYISDQRLYVTDANVSRMEAASVTAGNLRLGEYVWLLGEDGHLSLR